MCSSRRKSSQLADSVLSGGVVAAHGQLAERAGDEDRTFGTRSSGDGVMDAERTTEFQAAIGRSRHVDRSADARVEGGFFVADSCGFDIDDAHAAVARQGNFSGSEASGANQHGGGEKNLFHRFSLVILGTQPRGIRGGDDVFIPPSEVECNFR